MEKICLKKEKRIKDKHKMIAIDGDHFFYLKSATFF
ncbi:hypothetical protein SAMN05443633_110131 [Chryseobacterium arachidis]|uniref:Uncharacterized protein n=1 Tax=Chryseobacterium arachidis TaxID=1416778 RepID=A0A1M5HA91_9FLAO|nr:hypothetical protein SAMN05443633_110131 [Chryseobacterium arachidis]